jgi:hypothetical protein
MVHKKCFPGDVGAPHGGENFERLLGCPQFLDGTFNVVSEILSAYADCRELAPIEREGLEEMGIPSEAFDLKLEARKTHFKILAASIIRLPVGRFEFSRYHRGDEEPVTAAIILCRNETNDLADVAAWVPATNEISLWLDRIDMLGQENALAPRPGHPLFAYASPREWLERGRDGVVVLNPQRARSLLYAASPIAVQSIEFGQWLRGALAAPLPRILLHEPSGGTAA